MPRPPRLEFEGAFYHVFSRGNRRERIFHDAGDYARFEQLLIDALRWSGACVYAWCLMPNHFHLLVKTPEGNLSEFMRRLLTRYAKFFNWKHGLVGHVFQGRYGARLCDKDAYFKELIRYIHLNPYRGNNPLTRPGQWKWSSHRYYLGMAAPNELCLSFEEALRQFGESTGAARRAYSQFLADGLAQGNWEDFYKPKDNRFLGDDHFVHAAKVRGGEPVRVAPRPWKQLASFEELALWCGQQCGFSVEDVRSANQVRSVSRWRQALIYIARRYYRFQAAAIGRYLGRDGTAISQAIRRLKGREKRYLEIESCERVLRSRASSTPDCHLSSTA